MNNEYFNKLSQSVKAYIRYQSANVLNDDYIYIRSDTDLQEIEYNDNLDKIIGCFNSRTAKIKIMNPISHGNYRYSLIDKDVELFMGYKDDLGVHYSKKGTFRVKKTDSETVGIQTNFELQDKSFIFDTTCTLEFSYPCTRLQVVQLICEHLGIELATPEFWLYDEIIKKQFYNSGSTYREIIRIIAEASCCFAKIGDDDKLHIKFFEKSNYKLIPRVYKKLNIEDCFGYVNRIVLCETDESGSTDYDVIIAENDESIKNFGLSEVRISNNLVLNEDREKYAPLLLSQLSTFRYYAFSAEMVLGNYLLDHSVIDLVDKDGSVKPSVIMNLNFRYNGALKSSIFSPAPSKTKQQYPGAGKVGEQIKNVWLNVDKVKGIMTSLNEEITEQNTKITKIEQSSNEINSKVQEVSSKMEVIKTETADLKMTVNEISSAVQIGGGSNMLQNSVGLYGMDGITVENNRFYFKPVTNLVVGDTYTLTFKYSNEVNNSVRVLLDNVNEEEIFTTNQAVGLDEVVYTFIAKDTTVQLIIEMNGVFDTLNGKITNLIGRTISEAGFILTDKELNRSFLITDTIFRKSLTRNDWEPASGEILGTTLSVYYNGIEVSSINADIKTKINNMGFIVTNNYDQIVLSVTKDFILLTNTKIDGDLYIKTTYFKEITINGDRHLVVGGDSR